MELFSYLTYSNYGNVWQRSACLVGLLFVIRILSIQFVKNYI